MCSECKKGHLYLDAGQIKCHGYLSAWSKCTFTCPPADIKERAKWKYPSDDEMDELIEKIKEDKNKDKAPGVTISVIDPFCPCSTAMILIDHLLASRAVQ